MNQKKFPISGLTTAKILVPTKQQQQQQSRICKIPQLWISKITTRNNEIHSKKHRQSPLASLDFSSCSSSPLLLPSAHDWASPLANRQKNVVPKARIAPVIQNTICHSSLVPYNKTIKKPVFFKVQFLRCPPNIKTSLHLELMSQLAEGTEFLQCKTVYCQHPK